jgi:hypothetical protein
MNILSVYSFESNFSLSGFFLRCIHVISVVNLLLILSRISLHEHTFGDLYAHKSLRIPELDSLFITSGR